MEGTKSSWRGGGEDPSTRENAGQQRREEI